MVREAAAFDIYGEKPLTRSFLKTVTMQLYIDFYILFFSMTFGFVDNHQYLHLPILDRESKHFRVMQLTSQQTFRWWHDLHLSKILNLIYSYLQ